MPHSYVLSDHLLCSKENLLLRRYNAASVNVRQLIGFPISADSGILRELNRKRPAFAGTRTHIQQLCPSRTVIALPIKEVLIPHSVV